ncbi:hypothetical protein MNQ98_11725 [Paenibacillus sp. N3/727]|uniref:hypothetical protein n=1 Tax=Paenibacillus sp. N3/727 TaxID=2925845 RepID=UPI001F52B51D|nr:hypothetical protein [Paenibacillus sp. N3/727]UNK20634.1 hypothetical protein MNQ98_11725 [Paenibacillus sp. N3/727]
MPWPMVHFAIAIRLSLSNPSPHFLLGSIAPDAIHMREHVTRKEKGVTHFVSEDILPSVEVIKENCLRYLSVNTEQNWRDFILGYFAHIYVDLRWTENVYIEFESNYLGDRKDIRQTYNREMSQLEFNLLRSEKGAHNAIHRLQQSEAYLVEPLVTENEVNQYRDLKIGWLQDVGNEPKIKPIYFSKEVVEKFIANTTNELKALFHDWGIQFPGKETKMDC